MALFWWQRGVSSVLTRSFLFVSFNRTGSHQSILSKRPSLILPFSGNNQTNSDHESGHNYLEDFQAPIAKSGVLIKQANHFKTWKKRLMVLKGHSLFYYVSGTVRQDSICTMR